MQVRRAEMPGNDQCEVREQRAENTGERVWCTGLDDFEVEIFHHQDGFPPVKTTRQTAPRR